MYIYLGFRYTKWLQIDLVGCNDLVHFLVVTGKLHYPGTLLYSIRFSRVATVDQNNSGVHTIFGNFFSGIHFEISVVLVTAQSVKKCHVLSTIFFPH